MDLKLIKALAVSRSLGLFHEISTAGEGNGLPVTGRTSGIADPRGCKEFKDVLGEGPGSLDHYPS